MVITDHGKSKEEKKLEPAGLRVGAAILDSTARAGLLRGEGREVRERLIH